MVPRDRDLKMAAGTRLIHIGPYKTGTTALQGALHSGRERLAEQGVVVVGKTRQPMSAALAVTHRSLHGQQPNPRHWQQLVREAEKAGGKYFIASSEYFSDADDVAARKIVEDLGGPPKVQVVVTLRPLTKILPSQWQQYVQSGMRSTYEKWLEGMLVKEPYNDPTPSFWQRHQHDAIVERWAKAVGPENLTVVVVDDSDRRMILDTFENMLDLPDGFLVSDDFQNRSLTWGEIEFVRMVNKDFRGKKWSEDWYSRFMRHGAVMRLQTQHKPEPEEVKISTPHWALERAAEINAAMVEKIGGLGVRIVGDLDTLTKKPPKPESEPEHPKPMLSSAAASHILLGAVDHYAIEDADATLTAKPNESGERQRVEDMPIREVTARDLTRVLVKRGRRRARRLLRKD